ncbi:hypothetical protein ACHAWF_009566 [Thalassiosira exigua]
MLRHVHPAVAVQLVARSVHSSRRNNRGVPAQHGPPGPDGQDGAGGDDPPERAEAPVVEPPDHEQVAEEVLHLSGPLLRQAPQPAHAGAGRPPALQGRDLPEHQGQHHQRHHLPHRRGKGGGDHRQDPRQVHRRALRVHGHGVPRRLHQRPRAAPPRGHPRVLRPQARGLDRQGLHAGLPRQSRQGPGRGEDAGFGIPQPRHGAQNSQGSGGRDPAKGAEQSAGEGGERLQRPAGERQDGGLAADVPALLAARRRAAAHGQHRREVHHLAGERVHRQAAGAARQRGEGQERRSGVRQEPHRPAREVPRGHQGDVREPPPLRQSAQKFLRGDREQRRGTVHERRAHVHVLRSDTQVGGGEAQRDGGGAGPRQNRAALLLPHGQGLVRGDLSQPAGEAIAEPALGERRRGEGHDREAEAPVRDAVHVEDGGDAERPRGGERAEERVRPADGAAGHEVVVRGAGPHHRELALVQGARRGPAAADVQVHGRVQGVARREAPEASAHVGALPGKRDRPGHVREEVVRPPGHDPPGGGPERVQRREDVRVHGIEGEAQPRRHHPQAPDALPFLREAQGRVEVPRQQQDPVHRHLQPERQVLLEHAQDPHPRGVRGVVAQQEPRRGGSIRGDRGRDRADHEGAKDAVAPAARGGGAVSAGVLQAAAAGDQEADRGAHRSRIFGAKLGEQPAVQLPGLGRHWSIFRVSQRIFHS